MDNAGEATSRITNRISIVDIAVYILSRTRHGHGRAAPNKFICRVGSNRRVGYVRRSSIRVFLEFKLTLGSNHDLVVTVNYNPIPFVAGVVVLVKIL